MAPVPLSPALGHEEANTVPPADNLKGKNALITGGASGISLAIGTSFAEKGAYVTLVDINEEAGKQHAERLQARGLRVQFIKADVRSWQSQVEAFKSALRFHPEETLDTVVAGAGIFGGIFVAPDEPGINSLDDTPPEPPTIDWETNCIGLSFTAKLAQIYFEFTQKSTSSEPKSLLLIGSLAAYFDIPMMSAYTSSKYGARGLFRNIRPILASRGHRVNLMAPWIIPTTMTAEWMTMFRAVGAPEGHVDQAVMSALRCASDKHVNGRAFCIGPHRVLDLEDDPEGWNAGKAMHEFLSNDVVDWPEKEKKMLAMMGFPQ